MAHAERSAIEWINSIQKDCHSFQKLESKRRAVQQMLVIIFLIPDYCILLIFCAYSDLNVFSVFACLGFLSPANRGALMTCALVLYVCLGTPAGYVSSRIYKSK